MEVVGWLAWIIIGAAAGWLASNMMYSRRGPLGDIGAGIVGAVTAGVLFDAIGAPGLTGFNIWSLFAAFVGAVLLLGASRLVSGGIRFLC